MHQSSKPSERVACYFGSTYNLNSYFAIIDNNGALAEKLGTGLQNQLDGSVTRTCLHEIVLYIGAIFV